MTALMLIRDDGAVAAAQAIYSSPQSERFGFKVEGMPFAFFFTSDLEVKGPPGIDPRIGEPDELDVFEIKETFAIRERVERVNG